MRRQQLLALFLLLASACSSLSGDHFGAQEMSFAALPGWQDDNHAEALTAFLAGCQAKKSAEPSTGSGLQLPPEVRQSLCDEASTIPPTQARLFFEERFIPYRINNNGNEQGLFTGYYEPALHGSLTKTSHYIYPLYKAPPELDGSKAYFTRADIDRGALADHHLELLWVDDAVMRFFLQVQGSGVIHLTNGKEMRVGFAARNKQPYVSLGKILGDEGLLPKDHINFFSIREWLYAHPDRAMEVMEKNPSYVFFRALDTNGVIGGSGAILTPERSLAIDTRYIPYGLPLFIDATLPKLHSPDTVPFHQLLIAQDTGTAIQGPVRGDIFFGEGENAEYLAGEMKSHGVYSLLVPKEIAYQLQP